MTNLDDLKNIAKIDSKNILKNIRELPDQCEAAFREIEEIDLPSEYKDIKNILIWGMGGSAIGGSLTKGLVGNQANVPIIIKRDYNLPGFVDSSTLVLAVSYSGNTEEPLTIFREAEKKKAKLLAVSTNGELEKLANQFKCPFYKFNYPTQPRAALGYLFISVLFLLSKIGIIEIGKKDFQKAIEELKNRLQIFDVKNPEEQNPAKKIARKIHQNIPLIYGADFLAEVARRWKTQFNENSKNFSFFEILPELNHNSIVGYDFPEEVKQRFFVILLISEFYHPRNRIRFDITKDILYQKDIPYYEVKTYGQTPLSQLLTTVFLGDFASFYLAILNEINPTPIEIIDYLKDRLSKI
jgi:glucose/mannose-6-phosphate isomerase